MSEKETFIVRTEWWGAILEMSDSEQLKVFKNLFKYHLGQFDDIVVDTPLLKIFWKLVEPNLIRNIFDYNKKRETSANNGKLGGRPSKKEPTEKPNNPEVNRLKPNNPIVIVTDSVIDKEKIKKENPPRRAKAPTQNISEVEQKGIVWAVKLLNKSTGKKFLDTSEKTKQLIVARIREGRTGKDFEKVIIGKSKQWKGTENEIYLRPETLFNATKFDSYVNEPDVGSVRTKEEQEELIRKNLLTRAHE